MSIRCRRATKSRACWSIWASSAMGSSSSRWTLARRYDEGGCNSVAGGVEEAVGLMNPWFAIPATGDRRRRALRLARAHDAVLSGAPPPPELRGVIVDSWGRCAGARGAPQRRLGPPAVV